MKTNEEQSMVLVSECLEALGYSKGGKPEKEFKALIHKYGIRIVSEFPYGRGVMRFMARSQMEEILSHHREKTANELLKRTHACKPIEQTERVLSILEEQNRCINMLVKEVNSLHMLITDYLTKPASKEAPATTSA